MIEAIFETASGRIYYLNTDTGLMMRVGGSAKLFVGSVDPRIVPPNTTYSLSQLERDVREGCIHRLILGRQSSKPGFTPEFLLDYYPVGIVCCAHDIDTIGEGIIEYSMRFMRTVGVGSVALEIGSAITAVYRQLRPSDRRYDLIPS